MAPFNLSTLAILLCASSLASALPARNSFAFQSSVQWYQCGGNIECSNISVPFDWSVENDSRQFILAVARYKATAQPHLGSLFFNPGGPSESGNYYLYTEEGQALSALGGGHYDIITWDPRGVNMTVPRVSCFDSALDEYEFYRGGLLTSMLDLPANFGANVSIANSNDVHSDLKTQIIRKRSTISALFGRCADKTGEAVSYMGTLNVVKDLDYLSRLIDGPDSPLNYYGVSYGTVIGQLLPKVLDPSRLGCIAIDGVADISRWMATPQIKATSTGASDFTAVYSAFAKFCVESPDNCALASLGTPAKVFAAIETFINNLYFSPAPYPYDVTTSGMTVPAQLGRDLLRRVAYSPAQWPLASQVIAAGLAGNYTSLVELIQPSLGSVSLGEASKVPDSTNWAIAAIACADSLQYPGPTSPSIATLTQYMLEALKQSPLTGDMWFHMQWCDLWPPSKSRYNGNYTLAPNTLKTPFLILNNEIDPATPLRNAQVALDNFGTSNARLIVQNGTSHITFTQPSNCTLAIMASYFVSGVVPSNTTTFCSINSAPFSSST
ncbi:hypothetical protein T439DRAFT_379701 [Meredithblackwellia eburnea MCA 4105]